jgi:choline dehydrogenase
MNSLMRYLLRHQGPLTSNIAEAGGFLATIPDASAPDLQLFFAPAYFLNHGLWRPDGHGFTVVAAILRPQSRGCITLASGDSFDAPVIDPAYLCEAARINAIRRTAESCYHPVGTCKMGHDPLAIDRGQHALLCGDCWTGVSQAVYSW